MSGSLCPSHRNENWEWCGMLWEINAIYGNSDLINYHRTENEDEIQASIGLLDLNIYGFLLQVIKMIQELSNYLLLNYSYISLTSVWLSFLHNNSPLWPSKDWFIDKLLGAARPLAWASFPVKCKNTGKSLHVWVIRLTIQLLLAPKYNAEKHNIAPCNYST